MLDIAKPLVGRGFAVHWLYPKTKKPAMGDDWATQPVATFDQLRKRYRPGQNIGVRTGEPSQVGDYYLHIVDLDIRSEEYTEEAVAALEQLFPNYKTLPRVASGSGGNSRHYYFLAESPYRTKKLAHSAGKFTGLDGKRHWHWEIELLGTGKQAVMPPSIHPDSGLPYRWEVSFDFDLVDLGVGPVIPDEDMPKAALAVQKETSAEEDDDLDALLAMVNSPPRGLSPEEIADVLDALPMEEWCEDRDGWLHAGMAVHHETGGSDEGFEIWCTWSENSSKFDQEDALRVWASFNEPAKLRDVKPLTMASLLKVVQDEGLDFVQCQNRLQAATKYREALRIAAAYDLSDSEIDTVLPRLMELAKNENRVAVKGSIRKDLKQARKQYTRENEVSQRRGLEDWLADEVLRLFFNEGRHLRRMSKGFWFYDKGVWRPVESEVIGNRVYQLVSQVNKSNEEGARALQLLLADSGRNDTTNALCNAVLGILEKKCASDLSDDPLGLCREDVPSIINCLNGELWFKDGQIRFRDHNPEHLLTNQLTADFDPEAECPEWQAALERIFQGYPDVDDVIRHLEELMGYVLQPTRSMAAWVMFYGEGSNGKSMIAQVLQAIMGPKSSCNISLVDFGDGKSAHAEAGLVGKLLLMDDDFKKGTPLPDDVLKRISETKMLTANPKYAGQFNFVCRVTPWILTNHWPRTNDNSWGLVRRAQVFHFKNTISDSEADTHLLGRILRNEREGVLYRLIEGWQRLQARGRFLTPKSCRDALEEWKGERNSLATFVRECIEITGNEEDKVNAQDVYDSYKNWSQAEGLQIKYGRNTLYSDLAALSGVTKIKSNKGQTFFGLKLHDMNGDPDGFFEDLGDDSDVSHLI
jgi:P4 family phage/plasmid primase-like protien